MACDTFMPLCLKVGSAIIRATYTRHPIHMPTTTRQRGFAIGAESPNPPLTREQIHALFDLSREDRLFHSLIVTATCTGMRLGDVCNLRWTAINLQEGSITVKTTRVGQQIAIPILLPLRAILMELHDKKSAGRGMVFPEAAHRYNFRNPHGIYSLRGFLLNGIKAHIGRVLLQSPAPTAPPPLTERPSAENVEQLILSAGFAQRKANRLSQTYRLFADGRSYSEISALTGRSKGQCSEDLKTIERLTGAVLRPGLSSKARCLGGNPLSDLVATTRRVQHKSSRSGNKRQISAYGSRSLRKAFCTLAMDADIPAVVIERIVGHKTAAEAFDQAIASGDISAMPQSITTRALALARDVIAPGQAALVNAVLQATGINGTTDPKRILSLLSSAVMTKTRSRIRSALQVAGIQNILKDD